MRGFQKRFKIILILFSLGLLPACSSCGSGGEDQPFVFPVENLPPPCSTNADCGTEQVCQNNICVTQTHLACTSDSQCGASEKCENNICVPAGGECNPSCSATEKCENGQCVCDPAIGPCGPITCTQDPSLCSATEKCENDQCVCDPVKGPCGPVTCTQDPSLCSATEKCENDQCVCDSTKGDCELRGVCEVQFNASLSLRADSPIDDQFDIPAACFYYNVEPDPAFNPDPASFPFNSPDCSFLDSRCHRDLPCCAVAPIPEEDIHGQGVFCDDPSNAIDQDAQGRVLAVTRWRPHNSVPIPILFEVNDTSCRFTIRAADFPQFRLQNSGLLASLMIDAGGTTPPDPQLRNLTVTGNCSQTPEGIALESDAESGLRFRIRFFANSMKGENVEPFTTPFPSDVPQILPPFNLLGVSQSPLSFTTGTAAVANPGREARATTIPTEVEPISITGQPIHLEEGRSVMSLVTTATIPVTTRPEEGGGPLGTQIGGAPLAAELVGEVLRKRDGQAIAGLDDLKPQNCGSVESRCTDDSGCRENERCEEGLCVARSADRLVLTMKADFDPEDAENPEEDLIMEGNPDQPDAGFSASASFPAGDLPFAKEPFDIENPPVSAIADRFTRRAVLSVRIEASSTIDLPLAVPETAGPFRVLNIASLREITLAKGTLHQFPLEVQFEPALSADGCSLAEGSRIETCEKELRISENPSIRIRLRGEARLPAAEIHLEEIEIPPPHEGISMVFPADPVSPINFGETTVGIETKTKLFRISNRGVRDQRVVNIQSQDGAHNFRLGSVYRGPSFSSRSWVVGRKELWTVSPTGESDLFFFLNYGPFGRVTESSSQATCGNPSPQPARCDTASLAISRPNEVPLILPLSGKATRDTRAVIELYIQDEKRFDEDDNPPGFEGSEHLFLFRDPLGAASFFSFRQDPVTRAVYLRNANGSDEQLDSLVLSEVPTISGPNADRFQFVRSVSPSPESLLVIPPGRMVKIGEISSPPDNGSVYQRFFAELRVNAVSRAAGGGTVDPVVGGLFLSDGGINKGQAQASVLFALGRAVGAPQGFRDLRINRLFAGFDEALVQGAPLVVSSATRGVVTRAGLSGEPKERFTEIYTIPGALNFDAERGIVTLDPVFTPINFERPTSETPGIRLFNGPGSVPIFPYHFACTADPEAACGFFFIFIGDWSSTTQRSAACGGRPPIAADPAIQNAIDPATCGKAESALVAPRGLYDPVSGEVTFSNLAVRLYAPETPGAAFKTLDTTLQMALTTECVTEGLVPDLLARPKRLVPANALSFPLAFAADAERPNPVTRYVDGETCAENELHGRPLGELDTTNTLDNAERFPSVGAFTFDLAAVGRVKAGTVGTPAPLPFGQATGKMMYLVIKAEAL